MDGEPLAVIRSWVDALARLGLGVPRSVLHGLATAGNPADVLRIVADGTESVSATDSASTVPRSTDEVPTVESESVTDKA